MRRVLFSSDLLTSGGRVLLLAVAFFTVGHHPAAAGFKFVAPSATPAPAAPAPNAVVEGFADRVPLAMALRQILPRGTVYNIAPDVDMGVQVSWQGGRPWQDVLRDSLASVGLQATVGANSVQVARAAYLSGNVTGTNEPIKLLPPVRLTPPLQPVTIDGGSALRAPLAENNGGAVTALKMPSPATPTLAVPDAVSSAMPASGTPVTARMTTAGEVTSLDPEFKTAAGLAGSDAVVMGSPAGYLTLPAGAENAAQAGTAESTLAPLDGNALEVAPPLIMGEAQVADNATAGPATWDARAGQTLREVLTGWVERANVELNWQSEYDYPVQASLNYAGTFEEAVRTLLYGFKDATPQPIGRLHRNQNVGQQALLITTRGNIYEE